MSDKRESILFLPTSVASQVDTEIKSCEIFVEDFERKAIEMQQIHDKDLRMLLKRKAA